MRHSSRSLELMAGYTYSKSLDDSSSLSEEVYPLGPGADEGDLGIRSAAQLRSELSLRGYPSPALLPRQNRWTDGWWGLSGITRLTSGLPVTLYNNTDSSLLGTMPNGINNNGVDTPEYAGAATFQLNMNPPKRPGGFQQLRCFGVPNRRL